MTPYIGSTAQTPTTRDGLAAGHERHDHRAAAGHGVHVHGAGVEPQWFRAGVGAVELGHTDRADRSVGADGGGGDPGERSGAGQLDRAEQQRQRDHGLHGHAVHRVHGADTGAGEQWLGVLGDGDGLDERDGVHVHGIGDQQPRDGASVGGVGGDHAAGHDLRFRDARPRSTPATHPRSSWGSSSRRTRAARSPESASTRRRPTPARTSAAYGPPAARSSPRATFTNETASGWQYLTFSSPVAITAGTTYVAGYFAPNGHYSATPSGLSSAFDNPPLHAIANPTSADGVYAYNSTSTFPVNSYNATNYGVDVMFQPTPPGQVTNVSATAGAAVGDGELVGAVERRERRRIR